MMYGCQQCLIKSTPDVMAVLEYICSEANKLYNCGLYLARQIYFKTYQYIGKYRLDKELKTNIHFFVYQLESEEKGWSKDNVLGIDPGLNNWLTCVSNVGTSLIIDGRHLKSVNRWYNKQVSAIKEGKPQGFWSNKLAKITEKRNRQMRDAVNKAARIVVNHCLDNNIGVIAFGWNDGVKKEINLGSKNNQSFVSIPTARLKNRIAQLGELYGIEFLQQEESYTSKASFLDGDIIPVYGEKPLGWKSSGKRTKRGLFRTAQNWYVNADCNRSANVIRKLLQVTTTLNFDLSRVSRAALTQPQKLKFWSAKKTRSNGVFNPLRASA